MSESRTQLEEILELLLAEENEKAEEMLHEYVVAKARAEYEKVLDEDVSEEVAEESEEAVEESVLGETGHYISLGDLINKRKHPHFPVKIHYYSCDLTTTATTQLIEVDEVEQISWVSPEELGEYFATDFDKKVAKHLGL